MKKLEINSVLVMSTLLWFCLASCSEYVEDINISPNSFSSAPGNLLVGQANLAVVALSEGNASRTSAVFTDQLTGFDRQYTSLDSYTTTAGDYDDIWNDIYSDGLIEARLAESSGRELGDDALVGVSQIMQSIILGEAAALWGAVPNTQAVNYNEFPDPSYDSQLSVFESVQSLLDEALTNVGELDVSTYGSPVFVQNGTKWNNVIHTLKARYYLITKNYDLALEQSLLGLDSPSQGLLANHSTDVGAQNLYWQFETVRGDYLTGDRSYLRRLLDKEDGISRILETPGDSNIRSKYFADKKLNISANGYFAQDASFPVVSFYENKLIQAEAALRTASDGLTPFNEVRQALANEFGGLFPNSNASGDLLLRQILEEKFIILIGSLQVFHDTRRTNNLIGVPIKGTNNPSVPERLLYPQSEINSNENFPGIVPLFTPTEVNN